MSDFVYLLRATEMTGLINATETACGTKPRIVTTQKLVVRKRKNLENIARIVPIRRTFLIPTASTSEPTPKIRSV